MDAHDTQALAYGRQKIADANAFPQELTYEQQQTQAAFLATVTGNRAARMNVLPMATHGDYYDAEFSLDNALASMDVRDGVLTYGDALRGLSDAETARGQKTTEYLRQLPTLSSLRAEDRNTMPGLLVHLAGMEHKTLEEGVSTRDIMQMVIRFERLQTQMSNAGVPISSITTHEGAMEALEAMDRLVAPQYPIRLNRTLDESLSQKIEREHNNNIIKPLSQNHIKDMHASEYATDLIKPIDDRHLKPHLGGKEFLYSALGAVAIYTILQPKKDR